MKRYLADKEVTTTGRPAFTGTRPMPPKAYFVTAEADYPSGVEARSEQATSNVNSTVISTPHNDGSVICRRRLTVERPDGILGISTASGTH